MPSFSVTADVWRLFVKIGCCQIFLAPVAAIFLILVEIAWETEVWVADAPSHLIHFNGERFLGPYFSA